MSVANTVQSLKEEISVLSARIKSNSDKIVSLYERMETVSEAIQGCRQTLQGFELLRKAYAKARVNDLEPFANEFDAVYQFCASKLPRWQQYWVDLNNECAKLQNETKTLQFQWEDKRAVYNRMVKVANKQGELL